MFQDLHGIKISDTEQQLQVHLLKFEGFTVDVRSTWRISEPAAAEHSSFACICFTCSPQ